MLNRTHTGTDGLVKDFKAVIQNAEELLKATADHSGDKINAVRTRAADNLREARRRLTELEGNVMDRTKAAAKKTDAVVHERPWQSMAVAAAASFILGVLAARRH